jgi:hypothetical protein
MITHQTPLRRRLPQRILGCTFGGGPDVCTAVPGQHGSMSVERLHLCIDVIRDGDAIAGTVTAGSGAVRKFSGRLGLFSTIDDEIEGIAPQGGPRESTDVDR